MSILQECLRNSASVHMNDVTDIENAVKTISEVMNTLNNLVCLPSRSYTITWKKMMQLLLVKGNTRIAIADK